MKERDVIFDDTAIFSAQRNVVLKIRDSDLHKPGSTITPSKNIVDHQ
jgi:hypothetical protein